LNNYLVIFLYHKGGYMRSVAVKYQGEFFDCLGLIRSESWQDAGHSPINETLYENWRGEKFDCSDKKP